MPSLFERLLGWWYDIPAELIEKKRKNQPDRFLFLGKDKEGNYTLHDKVVKAEPVGEERSIAHITTHDMMPHAVCTEMTDAKYLEGLDANAVYVDRDKFERLDEHVGRTFYQPMKILNPAYENI